MELVREWATDSGSRDCSTEVIPRNLSWNRDLLLTSCDDHVLRLFKLQKDEAAPSGNEQSTTSSRKATAHHEEKPTFSVDLYAEHPCGEAILDFLWTSKEGSSPHATTSNPAEHTSFFVSCTGRPIQLMRIEAKNRDGEADTTEGRAEIHVGSSFPGYNHVDEVTHAYSLACSRHHLFGGYESSVKVFDVNMPGRRCVVDLLTNTRKRNFGRDHPSGIISAIAFRSETALLAGGSLTGKLALYDPFRSATGPALTLAREGGVEFERILSAEQQRINDGSSCAESSTLPKIFGGRAAPAGARKKAAAKRNAHFVRTLVDVGRMADSTNSTELEPEADDGYYNSTSTSKPNLKNKMGGVTQLEWIDDFFLLSGHRKDECLRLWDIRMPKQPLDFPQRTDYDAEQAEHQVSEFEAEEDVRIEQGLFGQGKAEDQLYSGCPVLSQPVFRLPRSTQRTHQRIKFCTAGVCAMSGDDAGNLHWYRLDTGERVRTEFLGHDEVVPAVDWSLDFPVVATCRGSRKYADFGRDLGEIAREGQLQHLAGEPEEQNELDRNVAGLSSCIGSKSPSLKRRRGEDDIVVMPDSANASSSRSIAVQTVASGDSAAEQTAVAGEDGDVAQHSNVPIAKQPSHQNAISLWRILEITDTDAVEAVRDELQECGAAATSS
ncbi:unnamed protein product [Amoebophrya sp. A25]|nr:unnamed protein product [Amoebophrya sp. A25]|eukprot:GSA25T00009952001.1